MQKSSKRLNPEIKKAIFQNFFQLIADLESKEEVESFLKEFLSRIEQEMLAKRLAIYLFLKNGRSYEEIKTKLRVSSTTIATLKEQLDKNGEGFKTAFKKIEAEKWAEKWSERLRKIFA